MVNYQRNRSQVCVSIDKDVLEDARARGINLSRAAEHGISLACGHRAKTKQIDKGKVLAKALKEPMRVKMAHDLAIFDRTADFKLVNRWVNNLKTLTKITFELDDLRAAVEGLEVPGELGGQKITQIEKYCKECKHVTRHERRRRVVAGRIEGFREFCKECRCFE